MKILATLLVLLTCAFSASASDHEIPLCESRIELSFPINSGIAKVSRLHFVSRLPSSYAEFVFTNSGEMPITSVFLLVELRDEHDRYLYSSSLRTAYTPNARLGERFREYSPRAVVHEPRPIAPGASVEMAFESPFVETHCPSTARITAVEIRYADGSAEQFLANDARRDAEVADMSQVDLMRSSLKVSLEVPAVIEVNASGEASIQSLVDGTSEFRQWLEECIKLWKFRPAVSAGVPIASELRIIFRMHVEEFQGYPAPKALPTYPVQLVDFLPPREGYRSWRVLCGGDLVSLKAIPER
jgi:hypothetical protein